jgi:aspartyl-tRNA(Asn)/glutamyl-tRNA(Gln) amidotransferase subunit A
MLDAKLQQASVILLGKLATHEFAYGGRHSTFPRRLPETHGTASTSLVVRSRWLDPGYIGAVCRFETDYGLVSRIRGYTNSFSYNHVGPMTWTAAANHADYGGGEVLGSVACEFRPGE